MLKSIKKLNKGILYVTLLLVFVGIFIFFSASLSSLKDIDFFFSIFFKQVIAVLAGLTGMIYIATSKTVSGLWLRRNSLYIFCAAIIIQLLVVVPGVGLELKGAKR
jgi:cell division protein FtsW (lipid II flippase)